MTDKNGTHQQRRAALDRSRYDVDPRQLKPLPKDGQWAR
ncbi:membrane protein, partial [Pseudomonas syringae pv. actinidiae ICMP 18804]